MAITYKMDWYEEEVTHLDKESLKNGFDAEVIFYGSSSIRLWSNLAADFPERKVVNLGFGGSTLAACVWFFQRILSQYKPKALVVYAGDNDLGDGRNPEELFIFFQQLVIHAADLFGDIPCYFVSMKPSPNRWDLVGKFMYANNLIETEIIKKNKNWTFIDIFKKMLDKSGQPIPELYSEDGLHLSEKGYLLWKETINPFLISR